MINASQRTPDLVFWISPHLRAHIYGNDVVVECEEHDSAGMVQLHAILKFLSVVNGTRLRYTLHERGEPRTRVLVLGVHNTREPNTAGEARSLSRTP